MRESKINNMVFDRSSVDMVAGHTFVAGHTLVADRTLAVVRTLAVDHTFVVVRTFVVVHIGHTFVVVVPIVDCIVEPGNLQLIGHCSYMQIGFPTSA